MHLSKNKIELKSSKTYLIPGSTIGKLDINQPLIYCHRPINNEKIFEIRYGQYFNAMGDTDIDLFQDRTPRPSLNFTKLFTTNHPTIYYIDNKKDEWVSHYGVCAVNRLKRKVTSSWQDHLTKCIIYESLKNINTIEELNALRESVCPTLF